MCSLTNECCQEIPAKNHLGIFPHQCRRYKQTMQKYKLFEDKINTAKQRTFGNGVKKKQLSKLLVFPYLLQYHCPRPPPFVWILFSGDMSLEKGTKERCSFLVLFLWKLSCFWCKLKETKCIPPVVYCEWSYKRIVTSSMHNIHVQFVQETAHLICMLFWFDLLDLIEAHNFYFGTVNEKSSGNFLFIHYFVPVVSVESSPSGLTILRQVGKNVLRIMTRNLGIRM